MTDLKPCVYCNSVNTSNRNERDEAVCANCSNEIYFRKRRNGEIIELRLDMTKVRHSTYLQIQALIQKDIEDARLAIEKQPTTLNQGV